MVNSLIITVKMVADHIDIQDLNISDQGIELLIRQQITAISRQIFSSNQNTSSINQINFLLDENRKIKIMVQKEEGNIDYKVGQLNKDLSRRIHKIENLLQLVIQSANAFSTKTGSLGLTEQSRSAAISEQLTKQSKSSAISRTFKSLQRQFNSIFTLNPSVKKFKNSFFENTKNETRLREKWVIDQRKINQFVDTLYNELNQGRTNELFSREELSQRIYNELEEAFSSHFQAVTGGKVLSQQERLVLRNENKIQEAFSHFQAMSYTEENRKAAGLRSKHEILKDINIIEKKIRECDTNIKLNHVKLIQKQDQEVKNLLSQWKLSLAECKADLEERQKELKEVNKFEGQQAKAFKQAEQHLLQTMDSIPAIDFPLEQLAYLPVNIHTEDLLVHTWDRILMELSKQGDLKNINANQDSAIVSKQVRYADTYLLARQCLPKEFHEVFHKFHNLDINKIEQFILSQPNALELKSLPQNILARKQQSIYQKLIRPIVDEMQKQLLTNYKDFMPIAKKIKDRQSKFLIDLVAQIEKKLDNHLSVEERQALELTEDTLIDFLVRDLEQFGMDNYYLSGEQIHSLREAREATSQKMKSIKTIKKQLKNSFLVSLGEIKSVSAKLNRAKVSKQKLSPIEKLPELTVSVLDLDKTEFEAYVDRHNKKLTQMQISNLHKNKKVVKKLIKQQEQLQKALINWDDRKMIIDPPFLATTVKTEVNVLKLSKEQVDLVKDNLNRLGQDIERVESGNSPSKKKQLQRLKNKKNQLQAILDKSKAIKELEQVLKKLNKKKKFAISQSLKLSKETFEAIPVLELPIEFLGTILINKNNQSVMGNVWTSILQKLHSSMTEGKTQSEKEQAQLQYKIAKNALLNISSPNNFKYQVAVQLEQLEKPTEPTQNITDRLNRISTGDLSLEDWNKEIQNLKASDIQVEKLVALNMTEANADYVIAVWKHLLENSVNPIKDELDQINSRDFLKKLTREDFKRFEDALFNYQNIRSALGQISHPLLIDKGIEAVRKSCEQVVTFKVCKQIIQRGKFLLLQEKLMLEPTEAEILIGRVIKETLQAIAPTQANSASTKPSKRLTEFEIQGLQVLSKALASLEARKETKLSPQEEVLLKDFVQYAGKSGPQRQALNAKLREMTGGKRLGMKEEVKEMVFKKFIGEDKRFYKRIPFGISSEAVELISEVTFHLRNANQFIPLTHKLENLLDKTDKGEAITSREQMTHTELGVLAKFAKIGNDEKGKSLLTRLQEIGAAERDKSITKFGQVSKEAQQLLKRLDDKFQQQAQYRDGDFVANVGHKKHEFYGHRATIEEKVQFKLVSPYSHGAKIYIQDGKKKLSHVLGNYVQNDYSFAEGSYSEVWRLDVVAMIPKKQKAILKEVYEVQGEDWASIIQKKYEAIENHIQRNEKGQFDNLKNPWQRRINAGKADYIWGGHVKKTENDFKRLAKRILGDSQLEQDHLRNMICSEFVTKTSLVALMKLNQNLSQEVGDYFIQYGEQERGEKIKQDENILKLPVSKKERLKRVHPGRMISIFRKRNCIKRVEPPKIIQQVIRAA